MISLVSYVLQGQLSYYLHLYIVYTVAAMFTYVSSHKNEFVQLQQLTLTLFETRELT